MGMELTRAGQTVDAGVAGALWSRGVDSVSSIAAPEWRSLPPEASWRRGTLLRRRQDPQQQSTGFLRLLCGWQARSRSMARPRMTVPPLQRCWSVRWGSAIWC